jgi:hypothetical protein
MWEVGMRSLYLDFQIGNGKRDKEEKHDILSG